MVQDFSGLDYREYVTTIQARAPVIGCASMLPNQANVCNHRLYPAHRKQFPTNFTCMLQVCISGRTVQLQAPKHLGRKPKLLVLGNHEHIRPNGEGIMASEVGITVTYC